MKTVQYRMVQPLPTTLNRLMLHKFNSGQQFECCGMYSYKEWADPKNPKIADVLSYVYDERLGKTLTLYPAACCNVLVSSWSRDLILFLITVRRDPCSSSTAPLRHLKLYYLQKIRNIGRFTLDKAVNSAWCSFPTIMSVWWLNIVYMWRSRLSHSTGHSYDEAQKPSNSKYSDHIFPCSLPLALLFIVG
jgi:hypothetical protein